MRINTSLLTGTVALLLLSSCKKETVAAAEGGPKITAVAPPKGVAGTVVTISGTGFDATAANNQCGSMVRPPSSARPPKPSWWYWPRSTSRVMQN